jgi:hypothetical protein
MIIDNSGADTTGRILTEVDSDDVVSVKTFENGLEQHFTEHSYNYARYRRGARGKLALSNEDMFIFTGQTFIFSLLLGILWIIVQILKLNKLTHLTASRVIIYVFRILFSLLIFDYQIIAVT